MTHEIAVPGVLASVKPAMVAEKAAQVAELHPVNPLAEELRALAWDMQPRHLTDYAGVDPADAWAHCAGRRWLLGLVHRILEPGWKHDGMLVLQGEGWQVALLRDRRHHLGRNLYIELGKLTQTPTCR
jgi:predicted P-loop ATPase